MAISKEEARIIYQALCTYEQEWAEADAIDNGDDLARVSAIISGLCDRILEEA